ncbi:hypothetical protein XELAEV_18027524mg [Xenopus laevis]|uniref:Uncharacterized protein n=1 Tax=Xenopus laevis TaxID=8355 RepID=A0A974CXV0_XENLA|nr:hypothetical protein XELAEV_18027524mg [Xenopus laevis]
MPVPTSLPHPQCYLPPLCSGLAISKGGNPSVCPPCGVTLIEIRSPFYKHYKLKACMSYFYAIYNQHLYRFSRLENLSRALVFGLRVVKLGKCITDWGSGSFGIIRGGRLRLFT